MTRIVTEDGTYVPVTVVSVPANTVLQVKTKEKDGYNAVVLGLPKEGKEGALLMRGEFQVEDPSPFEKGKSVSIADLGEVKTARRVSGVTKGKGFQGVVKRYNFRGHPASHGAQYQRTLGSVGTRKPRRVKPGKKMPGHMGVDRMTLRDVPVERIDLEHNLIALRGPLPGARNALIKIELA